MRLRLYLFTLSVLIIATGLFAAVSAENRPDEQERAMLVLDASGSMWGQIAGKSKIEIARSVTRDLLRELDPQLELGLMAYGHRRKSDCTDIELLLNPSTKNRESFLKAVNALSPKGKTPLSDAVIHAAEQLKYTEKRATVILVSDGIETCEKDPCAVGRALEKAGVEFTTHVIGFDLKKEEEQALRCLAESTEGTFFSADDTDSLQAALGEAMQSASEPVRFNLELSARRAGEDLPIPQGIKWKIIADDSGKEQDSFFAVRPKKFVPAGNYLIKGEYAGLTAEKAVTLKEDEISKVVLLFDAGTIEIKAYGKQGGPEIRDPLKYKILRNDQTVYEALGARRVRDVSPGSYLVEASYGGVKQSQTVSVRAGERSTVELVFAAGRIEVKGVPRAGARSFGRAMNWKLIPVGETDPIYSGYGTALRGKYPAGDYIVRGEFAGMVQDTEITVLAGETVSGEIVFAAGRLSAAAQQDGKLLRKALQWELFERGNEGEPVTTTRGQKLIRDLPEGVYTVKATFNDKIARGEAVIQPGETVEISLSFDAVG